jgi:solute carrier family 25 (mitochondrial iron transporter), member 28/37
MIPVDNIKTHCQAGRNLSASQIVRKIYHAGGLFNFYAGSSVVAAGCIPAHALYFSIYEQAKLWLQCRPEGDTLKFAFIGALSSMFHDLIMTPTEALKQRLQLTRSENAGVKVTSLFRSILKK